MIRSPSLVALLPRPLILLACAVGSPVQNPKGKAVRVPLRVKG